MGKTKEKICKQCERQIVNRKANALFCKSCAEKRNSDSTIKAINKSREDKKKKNALNKAIERGVDYKIKQDYKKEILKQLKEEFDKRDLDESEEWNTFSKNFMSKFYNKHLFSYKKIEDIKDIKDFVKEIIKKESGESKKEKDKPDYFPDYAPNYLSSS